MLLAMGCRCPSLLLSALLFGRSHFKNIRLFFHSIRNDHDALRIYRSRCMIDYEQCYVNILVYLTLFRLTYKMRQIEVSIDILLDIAFFSVLQAIFDVP